MSTYEKLLAVQSQIKAPKGQFNAHGGYKYRSCEDILEAAKPYLAEQKNLMAYWRDGEKKILVLGNFQPQAQTVALPGEIKNVLMNNMDVLNAENGSMNMEGYQFLVLEM